VGNRRVGQSERDLPQALRLDPLEQRIREHPPPGSPVCHAPRRADFAQVVDRDVSGQAIRLADAASRRLSAICGSRRAVTIR